MIDARGVRPVGLDQPAADLQLLLESFRNLRPGGGNNDGIIGRVIRPALGAVAMQDVDIVVTELGEQRSGLFGERAEPFDGVYTLAAISDNTAAA